MLYWILDLEQTPQLLRFPADIDVCFFKAPHHDLLVLGTPNAEHIIAISDS
jgi:hypothetical protein